MCPKITYICVYNNEALLNNMLIKSLKHINIGRDKAFFNTLLIDNTQRAYKSYAEACNYEIKKHINEIGDILIFLHQDIAFDNDIFQNRIIQELQSIPNQLVGFAGMPSTGKTISNLKYQLTKQYITTTQIREKTEVLSLDECIFAMCKNLYLKLLFDEKTCTNWHLYAADICYEAKRQLGIKSYVLPESIYHKYDGTTGLYVDRYFLWTMWKMVRKYRHDYDIIYTPSYIVSTQRHTALLKFIRSIIRNLIRHQL